MSLVWKSKMFKIIIENIRNLKFIISDNIKILFSEEVTSLDLKLLI